MPWWGWVLLGCGALLLLTELGYLLIRRARANRPRPGVTLTVTTTTGLVVGGRVTINGSQFRVIGLTPTTVTLGERIPW